MFQLALRLSDFQFIPVYFVQFLFFSVCSGVLDWPSMWSVLGKNLDAAVDGCSVLETLHPVV
jgi:hypothetical protein